MFSIYIHIPFCLKKCGYCDFYSVAMRPEDIPQKEYADAVCEEMRLLAERYDLLGKEAGTIYFGGGTPATFETQNLELILNAAREYFSVAKDAEITIEANPETIYRRIIEPSNYRTIFNRLSIGVQTFNDARLKRLGRIHDSETARHAVMAAGDAGLKNINIDLMWGLPGQTLKELENDLDQAMELEPEHISAYQLTIENVAAKPCPEQSMPRALSKGRGVALPVAAKLALPRLGKVNFAATINEDLSREMFLFIHNKLTSAGYEHYEISNYAKVSSDFDTSTLKHLNTSLHCRHNLNYWHYGEWLGLGSGATSFLTCHCEPKWRSPGQGLRLTPRNDAQLLRLTSTKDIARYLRRDFSYETEIINKKTAMAEYSFMGLRTSDGIDLSDFKKRFGTGFDSAFPGLIGKWSEQGMAGLNQSGDRLSLTMSGWLISDELFKALV